MGHRLIGSAVLLASLASGACAARAQGPTRPAVDALAARIPALLDSSGVPGLSIAVIDSGRVVWSGAFGVRNTATRQPVGAETVFEAASLTKPVFAYALLKLVDRGEFDLDRPLAEYIDMSRFTADPRAARITGRNVLSHTTGITGFADDRRMTMSSEPGSSFRYFGDAWDPLQRAVEAATGDSIHVLVDREVFQPLGMTHSSLVFTDTTGDFATPHAENGTPLRKRTWSEGLIAATMHTTATDYARFMIAAMAGTGLRPETARAWLEPQVSVDDGVSWGLGVGLQDDARGHAFWQWGHWIGTKAWMMAFPETRSGVVYLANSDGGLSIREAIHESLFGPDHPATAWNRYEQFDSEGRRLRLELEGFFDRDTQAGIARLHELERTTPRGTLDENMLNALGYRLMRSQRLDAAIAVFEANVRLYPSASNTHDSLGEAYLAAERLEEALASYRRSVELDPNNSGGRAAIQRIEERLRGGT